MLGDTAVAVHPDDERYRHLVGKNVILPLVGGFVEGSKRGFQLQVFVQYQYSVVSAVQDINMTVGGHGKVGGELHGTAAEGFARDDGFGQIALRRLGWRAPMVVPGWRRSPTEPPAAWPPLRGRPPYPRADAPRGCG